MEKYPRPWGEILLGGLFQEVRILSKIPQPRDFFWADKFAVSDTFSIFKVGIEPYTPLIWPYHVDKHT